MKLVDLQLMLNSVERILGFIAADTADVAINDARYCNFCGADTSGQKNLLGHEDFCLYLEARRLVGFSNQDVPDDE